MSRATWQVAFKYSKQRIKDIEKFLKNVSGRFKPGQVDQIDQVRSEMKSFAAAAARNAPEHLKGQAKECERRARQIDAIIDQMTALKGKSFETQRGIALEECEFLRQNIGDLRA